MVKQITDQPTEIAASADDYLVIRDGASNADKKTSVAGLAAAVGTNIPSGTITNTMLSTAAGQLGGTQISYTPTITAGSGTFTSATPVNCYYKQVGKDVDVEIQVNIANNGTAAGSVNFTLPVTPDLTGGRRWIGYGREDGVSGKMLQGICKTTNVVNVLNYDNTYPGVNNAVIRFQIKYVAA